MRILIMMFVIALYSCNNKEKNCDCCEVIKSEEKTGVSIFLNKLREYEKLNKIPYYEAYKIYGKPFYTESFTLSPESAIYQREILKNHYSENSISKDSIHIYETTWDIDQQHYITAWYEDVQGKGLKLIDTLVWKMNIEY